MQVERFLPHHAQFSKTTLQQEQANAAAARVNG
jgi:hypothetical protein